MAGTWIERVREALAACEGQSVVVAVSGGGDSVALLRALYDTRLDLHLSVAHLDHHARGDASRADAAFAAELAGSLGLPFDLGDWTPTRANHFESDARKARYAWLAEVAARREAPFVATGHTRDDQAETVLFRILRGPARAGLRASPLGDGWAEGVTLIRPLLDASRAELRRYLAEIGQPFREDASNADPSRTRNRIRSDLLPKLAAEVQPARGRSVGAARRVRAR